MKLTYLTIALISVIAAVSLNTDDRPNILFIDSEYNGQEHSCVEDKNIKTPYLDSFAKDGMLFENAYVAQAVYSLHLES